MSTLPAKKILIVDDDNDIVETVQTALELNGFVVVVGRDGQQGLALAESESPDLIILDLMMPKQSGFLILETIRLSYKVPTKVIMITGNEGTRHQQYAQNLGVDAYIRKPFSLDVLMETVKKLVEN